MHSLLVLRVSHGLLCCSDYSGVTRWCREVFSATDFVVTVSQGRETINYTCNSVLYCTENHVRIYAFICTSDCTVHNNERLSSVQEIITVFAGSIP